MKSRKLFTLAALLFGGATLFQNGCLNSFWQGLFTTGFPGGSGQQRILSIALDVLNEELFG
jgi:hypothetical protein